MPESDPHIGKSQGPLLAIEDVIARLQRLSEAPRPRDGYPPTWYIEASLLGDITAISAAAIRSEDLLTR
jgi:hypothetical protein